MFPSRRLALLIPALVHVALLTAVGGAAGQSPSLSAVRPTSDGRKQAEASRTDGAIRIDGRLDEEAWRHAEPIRDFVQKEPTEGAPPSENMEVWFLYDDDAVYIGARMHNAGGRRLQAPLGRRDVAEQAEHILVALDTFLDRRTAYGFGVTASGVRLDRYFSRDDEDVFDNEFDPVWEARTTIDALGWSAEMWIPFSQLRFSDRPDQVWGLNVQRFTPSTNETNYWVPVPRTEQGWSSRFGDLKGISGVGHTRRIELLPYVAGASTLNGTRDLLNPFDDGRNLAGRVGGDLKMGLGPNLTLEATINPDFGQVEADPAEVNLSIFETIFAERRPFFLEGASLITPSLQSNFFYSRRIGAPPVAAVSADFVDYPTTTTILAAAKLTGRVGAGTSLGLLAAISDGESARTASRGLPDITSIRVAPRTSSVVARVQQQFGASASTVSLLVTGVHRDLPAGNRLAALLSRQALTAYGESTLRFKGGEYQLQSWGGATRITGEATAIERIQRLSAHYFQRPDQDHVHLDPDRTSLAGYKAGSLFERTSGTHWLWSAQADFESPALETNDLGRLRSADGIMGTLALRYRETNPGRLLRGYALALRQTNGWTYGGARQTGGVQPSATLSWNNFWRTQLSAAFNLRRQDASLTRGGPLMGTPRGWTASAELRSSGATQTIWNGRVSGGADEDGGRQRRVSGGISFRPAPRWQFSIDPEYTREGNSQQYVATLAGGPPATFGQRYVFAYVDRYTYAAKLRLNYTLRPDMTLDLYAEPFAASGSYRDFGELSAASSRRRLTYGMDGTTVVQQADGSRVVTDGDLAFTLRNIDFNVHSFRSNVVLRWEWRPGSTLFVVWQQNRSLSEAIGSPVRLGDLWDSLRAPGSNYFVVKTTWWVPWK
jgi:hypothetical protein